MPEVVSVNKLKPYFERLERLAEEKRHISEAEKEVYAEAKAEGFDTKAMRKVLADANKDPADLDEFAEIVQLYKDARG